MAAVVQEKKAYDTGVKVVTISAGDGKTYPKNGDNVCKKYSLLQTN